MPNSPGLVKQSQIRRSDLSWQLFSIQFPTRQQGSVTIAGTAVSSSVAFDSRADDTTYMVFSAITESSNSPTIGFSYVTTRTITGFTINLSTAPGASKSVTVGWMMLPG